MAAVAARTVAPTSSAEDTDGDGMSDADEQFAGTDPADPQSVIRLLAVERLSEGTVRARWRGVTGRSYRLETSGNLGDWQEAVQHTATAAESSRDTTVPASDTARFFRIVVLPP